MIYSIPPAIVALLFLSFGLYTICDQGITRTSIPLAIVCTTSFFWQFTWAILFQVHDPDWAIWLVKLGYLLILFLPTGIYHFLVEINNKNNERHYVYCSYLLCLFLATILLGSNLFVDGYYQYFFGHYPKAGTLHFIHLIQTSTVVTRGLYITYQTYRHCAPEEKMRYKLCLWSLLIYFFAAVDYLCNYGIEFYPPGVLFIAISLGMLVFGVIKFDILNPNIVAARIAHEIRTPMSTIRLQADAIAKTWPILFEGYQVAVKEGLYQNQLTPFQEKIIADIASRIKREVDYSNIVLDTLLHSTALLNPNKIQHQEHSIKKCIDEVIERYPFHTSHVNNVHVDTNFDFKFWGSDILIILVLFNLIKNSEYAIKKCKKGEIYLSTSFNDIHNIVTVTDTATGIKPEQLKNIFNFLHSDKPLTGGSGIGLNFCKQVMNCLGGKIYCDSIENEYTSFILKFKKIT